jgi:hypothetical protein
MQHFRLEQGHNLREVRHRQNPFEKHVMAFRHGLVMIPAGFLEKQS